MRHLWILCLLAPVLLADGYSERAEGLAADDVAGWYRLALWAKEHDARHAPEAFAKVLELDPDHRAARRELGYEKIDGAWVERAELKRAKGFVLCGGKWVLPEEADRLMRAGLMEQAETTDAHRKRAEEICNALLDDDAEVRAAARAMMSELPDEALLRPLKRVLYAPEAEIRAMAVKKLGNIGDRVALPWLIRSSMYDADKSVRAQAFRSIQGFKDADVFYPYARALFSQSPKARIMAAEALASLGDLRGVDVVLRRISFGIGESGRANVLVGKQNSYIQDFDVEIAQSAAIGDPIIQTIRDGIILDYKILGGWGESWVAMERTAYENTLRGLTGRDFGQNWKQYAHYAKEQEYPRANLRLRE